METTRSLTRKEQVFLDKYLSSPKISATEAALFAYNTKSRAVAAAIGYENLRKPHIKAYMQSFSEEIEEMIVHLVREWGDSENPRKRELALKAAMWSHDKIFGRATVKQEQQSSIVHVEIDLSGSGESPPADIDIIDLDPEE